MTLPAFLSPQFITNALVTIIVVHVILLLVAYLIYVERKICAYIQDRIGPNRVGFDFGQPALSFLKGCLGLGQPLADGLKFFLKEDYTPNRVDKILFTLAPAIVVIPALMGFIVIPWGGLWDGQIFGHQIISSGPVHIAGASLNIGVIYLLAIASMGVYGITLGGWASNNKFSFLGSLRATAQMISYEIPLGLSILTALLVVGSVVPDQIIRHQVHHGWLFVSQPLVGIVLFIAILAEANRAPFDNAECEQELVGGYHTEYSSMRFALYFLAEYSHMVTSSAFFVLLFFGGYHIPFIPGLNTLTNPETMTVAAVLVKFLVFFTKIILIISFMMVIRWTIPRLRYDQIMMYAWQQVIPVAMLMVVVVSILVYFNQTAILPMLAANLAVGALLIGVQSLIPRGTSNRRLPLYGSRFNPMPGERVITAPTDPLAIADHPLQGTAIKMKG